MLKTWNDQGTDFRSDDDLGDQHCEQGTSARRARDYQINAVDNLEENHARSDYAYLEAPTGIGKTVVKAMLARSLGIGEIYFLAHTIGLLKKARASLVDLPNPNGVRNSIWNIACSFRAKSADKAHAAHKNSGCRR